MELKLGVSWLPQPTSKTTFQFYRIAHQLQIGASWGIAVNIQKQLQCGI